MSNRNDALFLFLHPEFDGDEEVRSVKIDMKLTTGVFIGMVVALHYHGLVAAYLPFLMVVTVVLVLKTLHN